MIRSITLLLAIYLGIALLSTYFVIRLLRITLKSRRTFVWGSLLLLILAWCSFAIWEVNYIRNHWTFATRSMPAVGVDWFAIFRILIVRVPLWLAVLTPSFPALATVLFMPPQGVANEIGNVRNRIRQLFDAALASPYRFYIFGAVAVFFAVVVRLCVWFFIQ